METDRNIYLPPLVSCNKFEIYEDYQSTIGKLNLDVGGYIRVSTNKDTQKSSLLYQEKYLLEWAQSHGYIMQKVYVDVKSGAYSYLRNDYQQLLEGIKKGRIKGVIAKEISRTSRDIKDIIELKRLLQMHGAFLITIKENYDSRKDKDEFLLAIQGALAQKERNTTSERVKITQLIKAKEGKTNVPSPAYGYKLSEDRQHLEIDPETSKIYNLIVEKFLEGWGQLKICKYLNELKIPSKRSEKWHTNSIKTILTNPVYLGMTIYNATTLTRDENGKQVRKVRPQEDWIIRYNTHPPLISQDRFDHIQSIIAERKAKDHKEWSCTKKYLLSGLLYCDTCGCKIYGSKQASKSRDASYTYVDQNRYSLCDSKTTYWNMKRVDDLVCSEITRKLFEEEALLEERIRHKQYLYNHRHAGNQESREQLALSLQKVSSAIKKQQEAFENDAITMSEYKQRMEELREQKSEFTRKLAVFDQMLEKANDAEDCFFRVRDEVILLLRQLDKLEYSLKEAILKKLVKKIYIKKDYTLKIVYNFEE